MDKEYISGVVAEGTDFTDVHWGIVGVVILESLGINLYSADSSYDAV